jgi:ribosomal protein L37AE/L43A
MGSLKQKKIKCSFCGDDGSFNNDGISGIFYCKKCKIRVRIQKSDNTVSPHTTVKSVQADTAGQE